MPYRRVTLDRGDMPRGGFFGSIAHVVGGAVGGLISGGPIGGIVGAIGGTAKAVKQGIAEQGGMAAQPIGSLPLNNTSAEEMVRKHQVSIHNAQAGGAMKGKPGAGAVITKPPAIVKGAAGIHGPRKKPRMRVTNPRALRRALRRAEGFKKLAMKTIRLVSPRTKGRFGGWKKSRKR